MRNRKWDTENIITNKEEYDIILRAYNRQINSYDRNNEDLYDEIDNLIEERNNFIKKRGGSIKNEIIISEGGLLKMKSEGGLL